MTAAPPSINVYETISSITVPTLVIDGTADPMLPLPHGEALAADETSAANSVASFISWDATFGAETWPPGA